MNFTITCLLYDVTMVFFSPFLTLRRSHWPMHGPHAFASTMPPNSRIVVASPSRSIVARICVKYEIYSCLVTITLKIK